MKICNACGHKHPNSARYCWRCHHGLGHPSEGKYPQRVLWEVK